VENKKNIPLIIGLSIPVLMIIFVSLSIYLPPLFIKPKFNFLYSSGFDYYSRYRYTVENGKVIAKEIKYPEDKYASHISRCPEPQIYIYDIQKNEGKAISLEEGQKLNLSPNAKSPDGFEVVTRGYGDFSYFPFIFSRSEGPRAYIKGNNLSKNLNATVKADCSYYPYDNVKFIGWVIN